MSKVYRLILSIIMLLFIPRSGFAQKPGGMPPASVEVAKVQKQSLQSSIELIGKVESPKTAQISAEVEGLVAEYPMEEGEYVKAGGTIAVLENSALKIMLAETQAQLKKSEARLLALVNGNRPQEIEKAKATMLEAKNRWEKESQNFNRNQEMFKREIISETEYNNSKSDMQAAEQVYLQEKAAFELQEAGTRKEEIAQEEAEVAAKHAQLNLLEDKINKAFIRAPFSGVLIQKLVERGEWVNPGKVVARLIQIDPVRVEIPVQESVIDRVKVGVEVSIKIDALAGREFKGKITQIISEADSATKTFPVKIILPNPDKSLKVGMTARVSLPFGEMKETLTISKDAVIVMGNQKLIYIVDQGNTAKMIPVTTGRATNGWIEVAGDGIKEGSLVVVKGNERLRPGQPVNIVKYAP